MNKKYAPESRGVFFIVSVADNRKFETRLGFQGRRKPTSRPVQPALGEPRQAKLGIRGYTKLNTYAIMNVNKSMN